MKLVIAFVLLVEMTFTVAVFGQDQADPDMAARIAAAQAALNAKPKPSTKPAAAPVMAKTPATQPTKSIPSIGGVWQGGDEFLTITQTDGTWSGDFSYKSASDGQISWEIKDGTISTDGKLSGKLHFTSAPDTWGKFKSFRGQLSKDGKTITGPTWELHGTGKFAFVATDPTIPREILKAMVKHTLAVGMTLEQCNKSIGREGKLIETNGRETSYRWTKTVSPKPQGMDMQDGNGGFLYIRKGSYQDFDGIIVDGKLASLTKGEIYSE